MPMLTKSDKAWIDGQQTGYKSGYLDALKDVVELVVGSQKTDLTLEEIKKIISLYSVNQFTDFLMAVLDRIREETEYNQGGH